jgi:glutamine synthetase
MANRIGELVVELQAQRERLDAAIAKAEAEHDDLEKQAKLLTGLVADAMHDTRAASDALELALADDHWPLPKYREMLFQI